MILTEEEKRALAKDIKNLIVAESTAVDELPEANTLDGVGSLPAYQQKEGTTTTVSVPMPLLAKPALDAAAESRQVTEEARIAITDTQAATGEARTAAATVEAVNEESAAATAKALEAAESVKTTIGNAEAAIADTQKAITSAYTAAADADNATTTLTTTFQEIKTEAEAVINRTNASADGADAAVVRVDEFMNNAASGLVTQSDRDKWSDKYTKAEIEQITALLQTALEKFVKDKNDELVGGAPETLNALNELAAAINNDPNFGASIMALIGGKADLLHIHTIAQIKDFPASLPASGGNADTVDGHHAIDRQELTADYLADKLPVYDPTGYIGAYLFRDNWIKQDDLIIGEVCFRLNQADGFHRWCSLARLKAVLGHMPASDVQAWAKAATKPTYTTAEVTPTTDRQYLTAAQVSKLNGLETHTHTKSQITDFPASLPANGGNASTVGGLNPVTFILKNTRNACNYIGVDGGNGWSYINLGNNGITQWDIATQPGSNNLLEFRPDGAAAKVTLAKTGELVAYGYATFVAGAGRSSDIRFKTKKGNIENALTVIKKLDVFKYHWNKEGEEHDSIGVSAQQIQDIYPELVHIADDEDKTLSVDYNGLIPVCMQAIKELTERIEKLENKNK